MGIDIKVPTLGESVTSATVARWLKKAGENVSADEPLVELETDKVTVEVPAPGAGVLAVQAQEGAEVAVGAVLGTVEAGGAAQAPAPAPKLGAPAAMPSAGVNPPPRPLGPVSRPATPPADVAAHAPMPSAAKLMEERGLGAAELHGTGKDGRITKGDVLDFLSRPAAAPAAAPQARQPRET